MLLMIVAFQKCSYTDRILELTFVYNIGCMRHAGLKSLLTLLPLYFSFIKNIFKSPVSPWGRATRVLKPPSFQTGEYATDEEEDEEGTTLPSSDMAIEVFELPENEDMFSPSDLDTTKLSHKFKEVSCWSAKHFLIPSI